MERPRARSSRGGRALSTYRGTQARHSKYFGSESEDVDSAQLSRLHANHHARHFRAIMIPLHQTTAGICEPNHVTPQNQPAANQIKSY
jgi:hypothetical protein